MTTTARIAARLDEEFEYDPRVKDAVVAELAQMCKTKKISASKLKDSIIISAIESHLADLAPQDEAPVPTHDGCTRYLPEEDGGAFCEVCDEGTMTDEINAASLESMRESEGDADSLVEDDAPEVDDAVAVVDDEPAAKARRGAHADCDHEASKAARARCRREKAKAAAQES